MTVDECIKQTKEHLDPLTQEDQKIILDTMEKMHRDLMALYASIYYIDESKDETA